MSKKEKNLCVKLTPNVSRLFGLLGAANDAASDIAAEINTLHRDYQRWAVRWMGGAFVAGAIAGFIVGRRT